MDGRKVAEVPVDEIPLEKQLEIALRLLEGSPREKEFWHTNLELIDAQMTASQLQGKLEEVEKQLEIALKLLGNEPQDKELWHANLELIDAKLKIASLEKQLKGKRKWS